MSTTTAPTWPDVPPDVDGVLSKTCSECGESKSPGEFPPQRRACRACVNAKARQYHAANSEQAHARNRAWLERNAERRRIYQREWRQQTKDQRREVTCRWRAENPEAVKAMHERWRKNNQDRIVMAARARTAVYEAVKKGTLVRPSTCSSCGRASDRIEAAHHDYTKPLNVRWLCVPCHRQWDSVEPKTLAVEKEGAVARSGRKPCTDCGERSPQGRHAQCHLLVLLQNPSERSCTELCFHNRSVSTARIVAEVFGGIDPDGNRVNRAIRSLRAKGHRIVSHRGGWWRLLSEVAS